MSVNTQFSECIVAATQQNKNLLFTISTANVKDEIPLPWKMLQEVNCSFGIFCERVKKFENWAKHPTAVKYWLHNLICNNVICRGYSLYVRAQVRKQTHFENRIGMKESNPKPFIWFPCVIDRMERVPWHRGALCGAWKKISFFIWF